MFLEEGGRVRSSVLNKTINQSSIHLIYGGRMSHVEESQFMIKTVLLSI